MESRPWRALTDSVDMALEARDLVRGDAHEEVPGVRVHEYDRGSVHVTEVVVETEEGARLINKPQGRYVTLDVPGFRTRAAEVKAPLISVLTDQLKAVIPEARELSALVVGLGNRQATPDALGPRTVERLLVTRHVKPLVEQGLRERLRSVAALAPGVLGTTGIETLDIVRGVVREVHPDVVIAIDALAARSLHRLMGSIQIADTGIQPGGGVGNRRQGLNRDSLGVPVVAVGVCTVVQASTIAAEALRILAEAEPGGEEGSGKEWLSPGRQRQLAEQLQPHFDELMVTPKEIDALVDDMAEVLAESLNRSLQPGLKRDEWT